VYLPESQFNPSLCEFIAVHERVVLGGKLEVEVQSAGKSISDDLVQMSIFQLHLAVFQTEGVYISYLDSSGVYIRDSIVNYLRHGNFICKSTYEKLPPPWFHDEERRG
jgi:hypothetical protein